MVMRLSIGVILLLSASSARADHVHATDHDPTRPFQAGVTMVAATYDIGIYAGNYQGIASAVTWSSDRFAAGASAAVYRLEKNGAPVHGFGDVVAHGQVTLVGDHHARAGVIAAVSAPIGNEQRGLGMGHVMAMPALFGAAHRGRLSGAVTAGYSRALGGSSDHDHGMWPLVEPMNPSELTWSAASELAITREVNSGVRFSGGVPIGDGDHRVVGALRAAWARGMFTTAAELQAGLVGDPFTVRGVVSTALRF